MDYPTIYSITEHEIDSTGAAAIFTGMVRGITSRNNPHETAYLEYESYKPMAEAKMKQVADEIRERWDTIEGIAIIQRIGRLYPRTPTILMRVHPRIVILGYSTPPAMALIA
jgi:molybdopterin synthase catalytic subunit